MQSSSIYTPGAVSTSELVSALAGLLSRFCCRQRTRDAGLENLIHGVSVAQNVANDDEVKFEWVTPNDQLIRIVVDLRAVDREYIDNLVRDVKSDIERDLQARIHRHRPIDLAVRRATHSDAPGVH